MLKISHIQAYSDNYIWLIQTNEGNTLVDPGDAGPVLDFIKKEEFLRLEIDRLKNRIKALTQKQPVVVNTEVKNEINSECLDVAIPDDLLKQL